MNFAARISHFTRLIAAILLAVLLPDWANAHNGGIVIQLQNGRVVVGSDNEQPGTEPNMDARAFPSLFRPELYGQDIPSFLSLSTPPAGYDALPPGVNVYWDFLPMTTNGVTSNLLYWNGQGTTVESVQFGAVPQANVSMGLYNVTDGGSASVYGTPDMVPGNLLGTTDAVGSLLRMHRHNWFLLDDGDGGIPPTVVPEGVYLIAMQLRIDGYGTSDPFYVVPGTYELISQSLPSLDAALAWVSQHTETLILRGDYDFDGDVDAADHTAWRAQFGSTGPYPVNGDYADGNRDTVVNAADYIVWRNNLGAVSTGNALVGAAAVPEPTAVTMLLVGVTLLIMSARSSRRANC
jgi:hypothetical protein